MRFYCWLLEHIDIDCKLQEIIIKCIIVNLMVSIMNEIVNIVNTQFVLNPALVLF